MDKHETQATWRYTCVDKHETKATWRYTCVDKHETKATWRYTCVDRHETKAMWRYTCVDRNETQKPRGVIPVWISDDLLQQLHFQRLYPRVSLDEWLQHPANTRQRHTQLKQNELTLKIRHLNSLTNRKILNATKLHLLR